MKKIIASSVLATATLFPILGQLHTHANDLSLDMSVTHPVEIRKGATASYPTVATLNPGQTVKIIDEFTNLSGEKWYRVDLGAVKGWGLSSKFNSPLNNQATITGNNVNVRKGATTSYEIITKVTSGTKITILDSFVNSNNEKWYRIQAGTIIGWVIEDYVQLQTNEHPPPPAVTENIIKATNAAVRKGATSSYDIVTQVKKGQKVSIIDTFKNSAGETWYRIDLGTIKGWIHEKAFEEEVLAPPPEVKTVKVEKAEVRKGATTDYDIITNVTKGQSVTIIDTFKNSLGETWFRIEIGASKGWVHESAFNEALPPVPDQPELPNIGTYVFSNKQSVDVRRGATTSYQSVYKLALNQRIKVIDHFIHTNGEAWLRIEVNPNLMGWVKLTDVSLTEAISMNLFISVPVANLRSGPSLSNPVIEQATQGTKFTATRVQKDNNGENWYMVSSSTNQELWAHQSVVTVGSPPIVSDSQLIGTHNAALYSGATYQYSIREQLPYNSRVSVLGEFTNASGEHWIQIRSQAGNTGWVPRFELVTTQSDYTFIYAKANAQLRRGASNSYAIRTTLKENETLKVLQRLNNWINVENTSGIRGWVLDSQTTTVSSNKLSAPSVEVSGQDSFIKWIKPSTLNVSYTTLSSNRLRISGNMSNIDVPSQNIRGIKSIETFSSGGVMSTVLTFEPGYTFLVRNYEEQLSIKVTPFGLNGKTIIIDPGHGGRDSGAVGPTGLMEKDVNLATALLLKAELEKYGANIIMTRSTDVFIELADRTRIANNSTADAFISIHADSFSATSNGTTTFYNSTVNFNGPKSKSLGEYVQKNMVTSMNTYNRGVREQSFYVNRMNHLPSVLVELAFLSNPNEEALLKTTEFRRKASEGITKGLESYFNNF